MEDWELEFEWLKIRHFIKGSFQKEELPDLQTLLFLVGIQEANVLKSEFTKEEKQDLMHVATCHLLSLDGYYEFIGKDDDGWPHYKQIRIISKTGITDQEKLLKSCMIKYFRNYEDYISEHNE